MDKVTIELITRGEPMLEEVLRSISKQTYGSFDVVCCDSSPDSKSYRLLEDYGASIIKSHPQTKALEARFKANSKSTGKFSLLLDSTRILVESALAELVNSSRGYDMLSVHEVSLGSGFWVRQAKRYRTIPDDPQNVVHALNNVYGYVLPRFYESSILKSAFQSLYDTIPIELFRQISYGEHHLLFEQALKYGTRVGHIPDGLILHKEDSTLLSIWRKYYYYGTTQRYLKQLSGYKAGSLRSHRRTIPRKHLFSELECAPIIAARSIAFLFGMFRSYFLQ